MKESASEVNQLLRLLDAKLNTELSDGLVIVLERFKSIIKFLRNVGLAILTRLFESIITQNRENTWDDMCCDSGCSAVFDPLNIQLVVVKKLSNDDV